MFRERHNNKIMKNYKCKVYWYEKMKDKMLSENFWEKFFKTNNNKLFIMIISKCLLKTLIFV